MRSGRTARLARAAREYGGLAAGFARYSFGLPGFARRSITLEQAEAGIRRGLAGRAAALLGMVERAVFGHSSSPYLKLLRAAGCEAGDLRRLVEREGVEAALRALYQVGVFVSFEEFKGFGPAVRGSQRFCFQEGDFDNPLVRPHLFGRTSGSRGRPTRLKLDLELIAQLAPHWAVWFAAHGVLREPLVFVHPRYPTAVTHHLMALRFGNRFVRWFCTGDAGSRPYQLASNYVHGLAHLVAGFPKPEPVSPSEPSRVAEYLAGLAAAGRRPGVNTTPSMAVRIGLAAQQRNLSLHGVTFLLGGEPLTPTRKATIEASGARATVTYGFSEGGNVGNQCAAAPLADDVHISLDVFAAIQRPRLVGDGSTVDALLLTTFRSASPLVLLNAEIGDYAHLETRRCDCRFDALGYHQHLHTIRSFGKLTGDGVTFFDADVLHLFEAVLPQRFGGTLADYQLVETQTAEGLPRYELLVSPELGPLDEPALAAGFLEELARLRRPYPFMTEQWARSGALRVRRAQPEPGARGKVPPFRTLGPS